MHQEICNYCFTKTNFTRKDMLGQVGFISMLKWSSLFTKGTRLCGKDLIFNRIMLQFTLLVGQRILSTLIAFTFWIVYRVHRTWALSITCGGWMARDSYKNGTQFKTVDALSQALSTSWGNIQDIFMQTLVSSMPHRIFEVNSKNDRGIYYWMHFISLFTLFLTIFNLLV